MWLPIHMDPLTTALPGQIHGPVDELLPNPLSAQPGEHCRLEQEGVLRTVPGQINESDQLFALKAPDPSEATLQHGGEVEGRVVGP